MCIKNLCYLIAVLLFSLQGHSQIVNIPDANFKNALINDEVADLGGSGYEDVDTNNDGEIQVDEAAEVIRLNVNLYDISSMEGIEYFTNLLVLECEDNLLTSLDVTQNINLSGLYCGNNAITALDVSQNINLSFLSCHRNDISTLDVSSLIDLININCTHNNLTELDVTQNERLSTLNFAFNTIDQIDVTQNLNLAALHCSSNNLSSIDVTQNSLLSFLTCGANNIEELDLTHNPNLVWLQCQLNTPLSYLDLRSGNSNQISLMWTHDTPNLRCILVDDETYANSLSCGFPTSGWCKDENDLYIEVIEDCVLSTSDIQKVNFTIFPNPAHDILFVESQQHIENLKIYNLQGQLINEVSFSSINVSQLDSGLYFVQVTIGKQIVTKKFIKN